MSRIAFAILGLCAVGFWLRADNVVSGSGGAMLALMVAMICLVVGTTIVAASRLLPGWKWLLASPLSMAAITWLTLFALRPAELYYYPAETILPLLQLGYDSGDLSRAVALGGVGCATWSIGFLLALRLLRVAEIEIRPVEPFRMRRWAPWVLIAVGTAFAGVLFMRQGGPSALIHSAGALHQNKGSGFYGQLGIWMLVGVALYSLGAVIQKGESAPRAKRVLIVSAPLAVLSTLSLGSRGLVAFGVLAAGVVCLRLLDPSRRAVMIAAAVAVLLAIALEFTAVVRTNADRTDLATAVERTLDSPVAYFQTSDLSTFDDLVAMQQLIPSSIHSLEGSSLIQIPAALAPRAIWPGKPQPIDIRVTEYLYPGATAGSPITMQGELFWNFGIPAIALGSLIVGLLMGWSVKLLFRRETLSLLLYAVLLPSVFALLTRALGTMTANTIIGLVGVGFVALTISPAPLPLLGRRRKTSASPIG